MPHEENNKLKEGLNVPYLEQKPSGQETAAHTVFL